MQRKTKRLEIRLTQEQKALLRRAAEARSESLTQFILRLCEDGAREVLKHEEGPVNSDPIYGFSAAS
jgi:uncharacterized protein (DUF1778 family)